MSFLKFTFVAAIATFLLVGCEEIKPYTDAVKEAVKPITDMLPELKPTGVDEAPFKDPA